MAKRMVKFRECDRCPRNRKPNVATRMVPFSFDTEHWKIDLCDECFLRMEREMFAWGRLGTEDEAAPTVQRFTKETVEAGRRLADLRTRQAEKPAAPVASTKPMHLAGPIPEGLPEEAKDWVFDPHAIQRMRERHVSALEVLRAACKPEVFAPSDREPGDRMVHRAGGVKVVVDPIQQVIYTVGREDVPDTRKAV